MWYAARVDVDRERDLVTEWRELVARKTRVWRALDRALQEQHGIDATEFEVLDRLAEAAADNLRVQELADQVSLSQSALSRLVARLETKGLVQRCMCDQDRRGIYVQLQPEGRELHAAARPTHRQVLSETLNSAAPTPELAAL
jgi:DNA-binding MarR family transcriptional regulator